MNSRPTLCATSSTRYQSDMGKLLYLVKWLQPEIMSSIQELTQFMTEVFPNCVKGMEQVMQHVMCTPE